VPYQDVNVFESAEAREELVRLTGRMSIPVIVVDGQVVLGFDKARLQALLSTP
jgi:glutaredoxin 3